jgi:hypothetical protein
VRPHSSTIKRITVHSIGSVVNFALKIDDFFSNTDSQIKSVVGNVSNYRNLAIFATYSGRTLDEYDIQTLITLRSLGFGICIVVNQNSDERLDYSKYADVVMLRKNIGLDLAAIRDAIKLLGKDWDRLILLNDSVVWPKKNFSRLVSTVLDFEDDHEILVLVDSFQRAHHFQTFFLAANQSAITEIHDVFMGVKNWRYKRSVVTFGEIPMKNKFESHGITVRPLIRYQDLGKTFSESLPENMDDFAIAKLMDRKVPLNPSQHFWRELLEDELGCLKRSLVEQNPAKLRFPPVYKDVSER